MSQAGGFGPAPDRPRGSFVPLCDRRKVAQEGGAFYGSRLPPVTPVPSFQPISHRKQGEIHSSVFASVSG